MTLLLLLAMIATVTIWILSMIRLIAAVVLYVPLVCYIRGNLKVSYDRGRPGIECD